MIGKYAKIVLLSTLGEPKSLVEISTKWFDNKGRLYQPAILKEIKEAQKEGWLIEKGKTFEANMEKVVEYLVSDIKDNSKVVSNYIKWIKSFYLELGAFTRKVYVIFRIIELLTELDHKKAEQLDLRFLMKLPFFLRLVEKRDKELLSVFIHLMSLEEYVNYVEKFELQYLHILSENKLVDRWVEHFGAVTSSLSEMNKKGIFTFGQDIKKMKAFGG